MQKIPSQHRNFISLELKHDVIRINQEVLIEFVYAKHDCFITVHYFMYNRQLQATYMV